MRAWSFDGGVNVHEAFGLSGEEIAEQVATFYGSKPIDQMNASEIAATNVAKREYQKEYLEYWNSTEELTGTGRPVDGFIAPVAPFPAARPKNFSYYGYSSFVNLLDYTSVVIPVMTADQQIDVVAKSFKPVSELDREVSEICKCHPL